MPERPARLPSLTALRAFEAAARFLSFKQAAESLSLTPTAISHQIRALEGELGVLLFHRHPRRIELTAAGAQLQKAVQPAFAEITAVAAGLRQQPVRQAVTLSTTRAFASCWLLPRLPRLQALHPGLELDLHASDAPVGAKPREKMLAIRYGRAPFSGWHSQVLLPSPFVAVASAGLARRLQGAAPATWPRLRFHWHARDAATPDWQRWFEDGPGTAEHGPVSGFSDEGHAMQAAIDGQGVLLASIALAADALAAGILVRVPGPLLAGHDFHLLHAEGRNEAGAAHEAAAWLQQEAAAWRAKHGRLVNTLQP